MVDNFVPFAAIVADSFQRRLKGGQAFVVEVEGEDALYRAYLAAFPEGTNPVFKTRTEHDCSCCRHFIRRAGSVVSVTDDGVVQTVWDEAAKKAPEPYRTVATALRDLVRASRISDLFRSGNKETAFGKRDTVSSNKETGRVDTWNHFFTGPIPRQFLADLPDQVRGDYRTTTQVFERGLTELTPDAVDTVLSLIDSNALYRGAEHRTAVLDFQKAQKAFRAMDAKAKTVFVWTKATGPAARFRNTVIGTLVQDLSEGRDLEQAVSSFESKVAPQNYKRTTALVTPGMVKEAMKTIEELGLEEALERRFARIEDISVRDVLWVDSQTKPLMKGGIGDALMQHAVAATRRNTEEDEKRAEDIDIEDFISKVLPEASAVDLLFKSTHLGNLASLTAPVHAEPKHLFRWDNDFAWSYGGNVADSIKERVKKAGGRVEGVTLRVSLSWFNYDDLDLHIYEPTTGGGYRSVSNRIYFGAKRGWTGGVLDVDMNAGAGTTREAVENVVWATKPPDGAYKVVVNNYCARESSNPGFVIEVEHGGKLSHYAYNKGVRDRTDVVVATLHVENGQVVRVERGDPGITASNISQEKWGLTTEQWTKVRCVTRSPNYWGENTVGNKHTFFILDGCKTDEPTRGIYNEFLHPRLEKHRKVFELIGDKTKCQPTEGQLAGLGFSSTKPDSVIVRVTQGKKQRLFNVKIGG